MYLLNKGFKKIFKIVKFFLKSIRGQKKSPLNGGFDLLDLDFSRLCLFGFGKSQLQNTIFICGVDIFAFYFARDLKGPAKAAVTSFHIIFF